jgi:uncharacterized protein YggE
MTKQDFSLNLDLLVLVVGFVLVIFLITNPPSVQNKLDVSGTANMQVPADMATIQLSIQTESLSASESEQQNAMISDQVINSILALGISNNSISTVSYYLYINPYYDKDGQLINKTYIAVHTIKVELKDSQMKMAGDVIDAATKAGANMIDYVSFGLKQETESSLRAQLLAKATENARAKADAISSASNSRILGVYQISEGSVSVYPIRTQYPDIAYEGKTNLIPGEITTSASVSVSYRIG